MARNYLAHGARGFATIVASFPNTKLTKHAVKQVFSGGLADDFADSIGGDAEIHSYQLQRGLCS